MKNSWNLWRVGTENGKNGQREEDLIAEVCLRKNRVTMLEAVDSTKDSMCEAKRPSSMKHNSLKSFLQQLESMNAWKEPVEAHLSQHANMKPEILFKKHDDAPPCALCWTKLSSGRCYNMDGALLNTKFPQLMPNARVG